MKGYRTIIFSLVMTMIGMFGWKISPNTAGQWVDMFLAVWGMGAILLRQFTTTPVGVAASADLVAITGLAPAAGSDDIAQLKQDMKVLLGHVGMTPALTHTMVSVLDRVEQIMAALDAMAAASGSPEITFTPSSPASAPVAEGTVLAPGGEATALTSSPVSAPSVAPAPQPETILPLPATIGTAAIIPAV